MDNIGILLHLVKCSTLTTLSPKPLTLNGPWDRLIGRGQGDERPLTSLIYRGVLDEEDHCGGELAPNSKSLRYPATVEYEE